MHNEFGSGEGACQPIDHTYQLIMQIDAMHNMFGIVLDDMRTNPSSKTIHDINIVAMIDLDLPRLWCMLSHGSYSSTTWQEPPVLTARRDFISSSNACKFFTCCSGSLVRKQLNNAAPNGDISLVRSFVFM